MLPYLLGGTAAAALGAMLLGSKGRKHRHDARTAVTRRLKIVDARHAVTRRMLAVNPGGKFQHTYGFSVPIAAGYKKLTAHWNNDSQWELRLGGKRMAGGWQYRPAPSYRDDDKKAGKDLISIATAALPSSGSGIAGDPDSLKAWTAEGVKLLNTSRVLDEISIMTDEESDNPKRRKLKAKNRSRLAGKTAGGWNTTTTVTRTVKRTKTNPREYALGDRVKNILAPNEKFGRGRVVFLRHAGGWGSKITQYKVKQDDGVTLWWDASNTRLLKKVKTNPGVRPLHDRPLAAAGLHSYRYKGRYGWVMIGAKDDKDALNEARRSIGSTPERKNLQTWNGARYVDVG